MKLLQALISTMNCLSKRALGLKLSGWLVVGLGVYLGACASTGVSLKPKPRSFVASDYGSVYKAWTRRADNFSFGQLSTVLHVTATFESWEFRWAYVVRYAYDHAIRVKARNAMLRANLEEAKRYHRFFVTLVGNDFRESDLTHERSPWRVTLVDAKGRQVAPSNIEKIDRPNESHRTYFPSINPFRQVFRIAFPVVNADGVPVIPPRAKAVVLRFASARGNVNLRWDLK